MKHSHCISLTGLLFFLIFNGGTACNIQPEHTPLQQLDQQKNAPNAYLGISSKPKILSTNRVEFYLDFTKKDSLPGPRLMEAQIRFAENLQFLHATAGSSLQRAGKKLIVQEKDENLLRLVALSSDNVKTLDSGRLATLVFKQVGHGETHIEILTDKPIFAPDGANEGLLVSDPVRVTLD